MESLKDFQIAHRSREPKRSFVVTNNLPTIPPLLWQVALPPGEGRGEGGPLAAEARTVNPKVHSLRWRGADSRIRFFKLVNMEILFCDDVVRIYPECMVVE